LWGRWKIVNAVVHACFCATPWLAGSASIGLIASLERDPTVFRILTDGRRLITEKIKFHFPINKNTWERETGFNYAARIRMPVTWGG